MNPRPLSFAANENNQSLFWPASISVGAHLLLVGFLFVSPHFWKPDPKFIPSVIDVQMVDLPDLKAGPVRKEAPSKKNAPVEVEEKAPEPAEEPAAAVEPAKQAEISVAPPPKKTSKKALKYKTFKSNKVLKNALKRVKKKINTTPPKPLEDTLKKLRDKVAKEGRPAGSGAETAKNNNAGKTGAYGQGSQKEIELIDLYRVDVAYSIQKNWAYANQLAGGGAKIMVSIAFKVMPDGTITDIFFTDRSGNQYLDDSAYRAIVKSSPVKPHPAKLSRNYVEMGLRFTPEGIQ